MCDREEERIVSERVWAACCVVTQVNVSSAGPCGYAYRSAFK